MSERRRRAARSTGRVVVRLLRAVLLPAILLAGPTTLAAQITDTTQVPVDSVLVTPEADPTLVDAAPDLTIEPISPRGAFIRSMVVPGWGQSAFGSYFRGGVYFAGWAANWFMIFRNQVRLEDARGRWDLQADQVERSLVQNASDPDSMRAVLDTVPAVLEQALEGDPKWNDLRKLVDAREQQREDWIAWSIFWVLASGLDGYVTAHLSDFPADIDVERNPDRSISVGLKVPIPRRRP